MNLVPATQQKEIVAYAEDDSRSKVLQDFETARDNLLKIVTDGKTSLEELQGLCQVTNSEKYYAALASLYKTMADTNEKLLFIQEKIRHIKEREEGNQRSGKVTNQLIITSAELLTMIRDNK